MLVWPKVDDGWVEKRLAELGADCSGSYVLQLQEQFDYFVWLNSFTIEISSCYFEITRLSVSRAVT